MSLVFTVTFGKQFQSPLQTPSLKQSLFRTPSSRPFAKSNSLP